MARREWDRSESEAVQNGTGKGRRGKWRRPPDWAVRREPFGRVNGIGGRVAGCTNWESEGRTDSRSKTWVAPESARIGEGVIAHRRAGWVGLRRLNRTVIQERRRGWGKQSGSGFS